MRPSTRNSHVGGGARGTLQRSLCGLSTVAAAYGRRAPSRSRRTVHHVWCTTQRSSRSRTGARRSRSGCSRSGRDTPKDERKRIAYFDLLEKFACPRPPRLAVSMTARWPSSNNHDLPKPIRRRRPPFFLRVGPRASAVRSSAMAGRERAPMTRATPSSRSRRQTWQHEAEAARGRQRSHIIRRRLGAA